MKLFIRTRTLILAPSLVVLLVGSAPAQQAQNPPRSGTQKPATQSPATSGAAQNPRPAARTPVAASPDLGDYGVRIAPDPRLLAVMSALDAAGFESGAGVAASPFVRELRAANSSLDTNLRARLREFYERNRLRGDATPAQQAARYVSLAFALGDAPTFDSPASTDDLPSGVLEVLDFTALVREYYRQANAGERASAYAREAQTAGERLRPGVAQMLRTVRNRFRVTPVVVTVERIPVTKPTAQQKKDRVTFTERERQRRFQIVPDPLAVPGTVNLRVIADEYFVVLPVSANPASAELRRAYIQFLVDPIVRRFNREIAVRRLDIASLLNAQNTAANPGATGNAATSTTSVFEAFTRSLVAAVDARVTESLKLEAAASLRGNALTEARREIADARVAALADVYERGGVLAFYLAEQLDGIDASGFEVTNFLPDIISSFDQARETKRLAEVTDARTRARETARRRDRENSAALAADAARAAEAETPADAARLALRTNLAEIETLLRANDYSQAEERLRKLLAETGGDARIFFALAQAASLGASDATDETVQVERLRRALANYRFSIQSADADADRALLSRAHTAAGRIHAFLGEPAEAEAAFNSAIKLGEVAGGALREARAELTKLRASRP